MIAIVFFYFSPCQAFVENDKRAETQLCCTLRDARRANAVVMIHSQFIGFSTDTSFSLSEAEDHTTVYK